MTEHNHNIDNNNNSVHHHDDKAGHKKPPPHVIAVIIFFFITIYFSIIVAPFLAAANQPDRGFETRFTVLYVDFDHGIVGKSMEQFLTQELQELIGQIIKQIGGSSALPQFKVETADSVSDLRGRVSDQEAWAAIYISANATANLKSVLDSNCVLASSYYAPNAIGIIVDEGRSQTPTSRLEGLLEGSIDRYINFIASEIISNQWAEFGVPFTTAQLAACVNATAAPSGASFLTTPVDYTVLNNSPTVIAPVMNTAFGVGNILVAVFSSLYIVMAILKGIGPLPHLTNFQRMLFRTVAGMSYGFGIACVFATVCVGLAKVGSGQHTYSGATWAKFMATIWCHSMVWIFGMLALGIAVSPDILGLPFGFLLISNIIGGFSDDFSYLSYKQFYQIFPFNWSIQLLRNAAFGSFPSLVGRAAGCLIGEALFFYFLFVFVSLRQKPTKLATNKSDDDDKITQQQKKLSNKSDEEAPIASLEDDDDEGVAAARPISVMKEGEDQWEKEKTVNDNL